MPSLQNAEELAQAGMDRALANAEARHRDWSDIAYDFLVQYAREHESFISEDVSDQSREVGFPQPPTDRAWGSIYRRAQRANIIYQSGTGRSRRRHNSLCPMWRSCLTELPF